MQAIAEATLGRKSASIVRGYSRSLSQTVVAAPAHLGKLTSAMINDCRPQFPPLLMNEDFGLILKAAAKEHVSMPATEAAFYVNSKELAGAVDEDFFAVLRLMEESAG